MMTKISDIILSREFSVRIGIITLFVTVVNIIDPFGAASSTAQHSRDLANRVLAPYVFPASSARDEGNDETPAPSGREGVLIVLFDDAFAESPGIGWPIPYVEHAWLLRSIEALDPASIFVDFVFVDRPEYAAEYAFLHRTIASIEDGGVPVFVGAPLPNDGKIYEPLGEGVRMASPDDAGASLQRQRARLASVQSNAGPGFYELSIRPTEQEPGGDLWMSPALRLFLDGCRRGRLAPPTCPEDEGIEPERTLDAYERPMWLRWPVSIPGAWHNLGFENCSLVSPTRPEKFGRSMMAVVTTLLGPGSVAQLFDTEDRNQHCPPIATLTATQLRDLGDPDARLNSTVRSFLANRHVIVGGDFRSVSDSVVSPVHGHTPGAYYHGVALANLLSHGDRYYKNDIVIFENFGVGLIFVLELIYIVLFSLVFVVFYSTNITKKYIYYAFIWSMVVIFMSIGIIFIIEKFRLAPIDFLGVSVVGGIIAARRHASAETRRALHLQPRVRSKAPPAAKPIEHQVDHESAKEALSER